MSIYRQLWLAVISLTILAFTGSFLVSLLTARSYIEQQLYMKNVDNAASLGMVLSQLPEKDEVTVELIISAQFDTGHYQRIVLTNPRHETLVERHYAGGESGVPSWFVRLFPLQAKEGVAQVQDGWKQYGTIRVLSHNRFAYSELWHGTLRLVIWFALGGLAAGFLGTRLLRYVLRPLNQVVEQAHAIAERRFIAIAEPKVPELKSVVLAMNDMVARLKQMFAEEAARLDAMRDKVNHDAVSALPNRDFFMGRLREALEGENSAPYGVLLMLRLKDLIEINHLLGRQETDNLLRGIGEILRDACDGHDEWLPARLNGPDFAILAPNQAEAGLLAARVSDALIALRDTRYPKILDLFCMGATRYQRGNTLSAILSGADRLLATAEHQAANTWAAHEGDASEIVALPAETWRGLISDAIREDRIKLIDYPVVNAQGAALHREGVIRLQTEADGPWRPAGDFMPFAVRLNLTPSIDLGVVRLAMAELRRISGNLAVNLAGETIADWAFRTRFAELLRDQSDLCRRLWVEVPAYGALIHFDAFRDLCRTLKSMGCKVGIDHFGRQLSEVDKLADLGVDYVKVDNSFVRGIDQNEGNQEFLAGLCRMVHNIGIQAIALGVRNQEELDTLVSLGFDGVTGPAVTDAG